jgi:hypothetical protein
MGLRKKSKKTPSAPKKPIKKANVVQSLAPNF